MFCIAFVDGTGGIVLLANHFGLHHLLLDAHSTVETKILRFGGRVLIFSEPGAVGIVPCMHRSQAMSVDTDLLHSCRPQMAGSDRVLEKKTQKVFLVKTLKRITPKITLCKRIQDKN